MLCPKITIFTMIIVGYINHKKKIKMNFSTNLNVNKYTCLNYCDFVQV